MSRVGKSWSGVQEGFVEKMLTLSLKRSEQSPKLVRVLWP